MPWPFIDIALASVAKLAIIPLQDILSLPATSRMNTPGTIAGNWRWRFQKDSLSTEIADRLKNLSHQYKRNLCIPTE
jgi:4-alpha-glucanotransferase